MSGATPSFVDFVRRGDPLVSCVVPIYNKAAYLHEAVESLLAQEYAQMEIIIVDDGSTDHSVKIAESLAASDQTRRIRVKRKQNGGISDARNAGIAEAKGRVVLCLDADDIAQPTFLKKALTAMRSEGANLVCSDVELFGSETGEWIPEPYDPYYIRYNNSVPTLAVFDRELWVKTGGYKVAIPFAEDWEFFINCSRYDLVVKKIPEKLFRYRRTNDGLLTNYLKDKWEQPVSLMMLANEDLYNIKDVEFAQGAVVKGGQSWLEKFRRQDAQHPNEWLLKFVLGIYEEAAGNRQRALELYGQAAHLSKLKAWLPLYRIALIVESQGQVPAAEDLYHQVRILRPDMHFMVGTKADERNKRAKSAPKP